MTIKIGKSLEFQFYPSWGFCWNKYEDDDFDGVFHNFLCLGPFQFKWYSSK